MEGDPGQRLDFSTLIAYLLPGFVVEAVVISLIDSLHILARSSQAGALGLNSSLFLRLQCEANGGRSIELGAVALLLAALLGIAYFIGLVLDMCAHPRTLTHELTSKRKAYKRSFERFASLIDHDWLTRFIQADAETDGAVEAAKAASKAASAAVQAAEIAVHATKEAAAVPAESKEISRAMDAAIDSAEAMLQETRVAEDAAQAAAAAIVTSGFPPSNLEILIDAIFCRTATSEAWARHNWSWSFYEAARQMTSLTRPIWIWPLPFYGSLLFLRFFFTDLGRGWTMIYASAATVVIVLLIWRFLHRTIDEYRQEICDFYHTYKVEFVFGHLIQTSLIDHQRVFMDLSRRRTSKTESKDTTS